MDKFCVFCGKKPSQKTKEHIIPKWLIQYTGNLGRNINLGFDFEKKELRSYSFGRLTLPACHECNNKFSELEAKVKGILENIVGHDLLCYDDITILLDWFDKVRIGLWLYYHVINDNKMNISPNFHIEDRIGKWDRMLIISKLYEKQNGINFIGADTMAFQLSPSCFSLRVNNYVFFNASKEFLFSRRMGFPFPTSTEYYSDDSDHILMDINPGLERCILPLIKGHTFINGIEIYQPMYKTLLNSAKKYYDTDYVKSNSLDWNKGVGLPFIKHPYTKSIKMYADGCNQINTGIIGLEAIDPNYMTKIGIQTYIFQNDLLEWEAPSDKNLSIEQRNKRKDKIKGALIYNKGIVNMLKKELNSL